MLNLVGLSSLRCVPILLHPKKKMWLRPPADSPFTDADGEAVMQYRWLEYLGNTPADAGFSIHPPNSDDLTPRKEWPQQLVSTLGDLGIDLMTSCLTYHPRIRLHAGEGIDHDILQEVWFPLLGVEHKDMPEHNDMPEGHGRRSDPLFVPDAKLAVQPVTSLLSGQTIFPGKRHLYGIRARVLEPATLIWVKWDGALTAGTAANTLLVYLAIGNEETRTEKQRKR